MRNPVKAVSTLLDRIGHRPGFWAILGTLFVSASCGWAQWNPSGWNWAWSSNYMPLEIRIYNQTGTNDNSVQLLSVDTGTQLASAYYVYYTNASGTNVITNRVNGVNGTAISTNFTNLPTFTDGTGKNYRQLFVQYAQSGTIWFALTTNSWTTNGSNPAPTGGPGVPWSDAPFGDIEYAYMGSPYDTADATAINTVGIPMLLQLCTNVNTPVPGSSTVSYQKGFTNTNNIPSMLANMGEISAAAWFGAAPNTNVIRFVGPSSATAGGIQLAPGGSTNANPLYSGGWPGQVAPSFAPYLYQVSNSTPLGTGPGGYKIFARISNSIGLNPTPGIDSGTNDYFYWFSFDVTLLPNPNAPKPTAAQLNWLNGVATASNTPYYYSPIVVLTNGVIISSNKNTGGTTTNTGLGARYTPDGGAATNSWFSSYIYGAPATYSLPNDAGTNTGYVTLLPNVTTWSNLATSQGFNYHGTWAPSIQDFMLNEIAFGFAGGFVNSPVQGWPVWLDSENNQVPPGGAAPVRPDRSVPQTKIGAMVSASWWVQTNLYGQNQPNSPALNNNPWFSAWGQSIYQVSKVVYSHPISDRMKNAQFSPGLPLLLAHTNTNFAPATIQPWLEVYLYNPNSAGQSSLVPVITSSTNAIRLTNTPTGVVFSNNSGDPFYQITANNGPQGYDVAALPPGLKFDPYTAKIYGTILPQSQISPTLNLNPYILQLFAYNQNGVGTKEVPLYVSAPANTAAPSNITPTGEIRGSSFVTYDYTRPLARFTANQMGSTPATTKWKLTGTLPGGLSFSYQTNNGEVCGFITGTATNTNVTAPNLYTIEIQNFFGKASNTFSLKLLQGTGNTNKPSNFTPTVLAGPAGGPATSISLNAAFGPVILTGSNLVGATWSLAPDSDPVPPGVQWTTNPAASGEVFGKVWSSKGVPITTQGVLKFAVSNNFGVATNPISFIFGTPNQGKCSFTSYTITGTQGNPSILASTPAGLGGSAFPLNINNGTQFNLSNSVDAVWTPPTNLPVGLTFSTQTQSGGNAGQVWATVGGKPSGNTFNPLTFQTNTNTVNFVISNSVGVQTNTLSFIIAPPTPPPSGAPTVNDQTVYVNQYQWVYIEPAGSNLNYATWSSTNTAGTLPPGTVFYTNLAISSTQLGGILAGQVTNEGIYVVGFVATNPFGASTGSVTINVAAAPNPNKKPMFRYYPPMNYTGNVGSNTPVINPNVTTPTFPVQIDGFSFLTNQPASISASGLPPGLTLTNWPTPNGMSAQFVGTPTTPGSYTVPVTLSNAAGTAVSNAVFTIQGAAALPSITSAGTASGQSGLAFTFQLTANNSPVGYGAQNLPFWLTVNSNAPNAGLIHGTPPAIFQGTLPNIKVWATNAGGSGPTSNLSITITEPAVPSITSPVTATATNNQAFSYQITANNFPLSYGAQGLPTWLGINDNTGLITGTPPANTPNSSVFYVLLTASNTAGIGHTILTLTTTNPVAKPVVTSATRTGTVGTAFSYQILASGSPTRYGISPPLPAGLNLNTSTGLISGTPSSSAAQNNYIISASNAGGTGQGTLILTISAPPAPVISSAGTATATSGTAFSYTITASGNPTSFGATPLPAWASFNSTTGVISGTPGPANVGTVVIALTATNPSGTGRKNLTLTVQYNSGIPTPVITSAATASGTVGQAFNFPETASGSPTLWTISPKLTDGLNFNGASGAITGTPTSAGTYNYTVSAYNNGGVGQKAVQLTFTNPLTVPVITSAATTTATNGRSFSYRITATENPTSYAASNRPAWLGAPNAQGIMTGTPTTTGSANITLYASNAAGRGHAPLALSIVVNPSVAAPTITSTNAASGTVGQSFAFTFRASGGTPITWSVSPALPANLSLNSGSGAVTGAPQSSGTNAYTVTASNAGGTANQTWTLGIASIRPPVITSPRTATGQSGNLFSYTITASNNPTSFQASNRPAWLSAPNAQGVMTGTPPGPVTSNVVLYASNSAGRGHANLTITITSPVAKPVITSTGAITATQGLAFSYQITASGNPNLFGAAPLPPGLSVNPANGLISGTPSSVGVSKIELSARNAGGTGNKELVLTEKKKGSVPVITSANTSTGKVSQDFRYQITASGSPTSYTATDLPLGLNVNPASGLISGKPTRAGTNQVMLTASNVFGAGSLQMQLVVQANPDLPVITSPGVASGTKGFQFRYQIRASGNPTSYNAMGLPDGLSVNRSTGLISGVAKVSGRFTVMLSADNSFGTGTKPLNLIMDPSPNPNAKITSSLAEATLTVGQPYSYQITANNSPTYYSATGLPPGLKVNPSTGLISGWPAFVGEHAVTLEAVRDVLGQLVTTASGTKVLLVQAASGTNRPTPPPNAW